MKKRPHIISDQTTIKQLDGYWYYVINFRDNEGKSRKVKQSSSVPIDPKKPATTIPKKVKDARLSVGEELAKKANRIIFGTAESENSLAYWLDATLTFQVDKNIIKGNTIQRDIGRAGVIKRYTKLSNLAIEDITEEDIEGFIRHHKAEHKAKFDERRKSGKTDKEYKELSAKTLNQYLKCFQRHLDMLRTRVLCLMVIL